jgi:hypothetical protein
MIMAAAAARKKSRVTSLPNEPTADQLSKPNIKTAVEIAGILLKTGMSDAEAWQKAGTIFGEPAYTSDRAIGIISESAYSPEKREHTMARGGVATKPRKSVAQSNGHAAKYDLRKKKRPQGDQFKDILARACIRIREKTGMPANTYAPKIEMDTTTYYRIEKAHSEGLAGEHVDYLCTLFGDGDFVKGIHRVLEIGVPKRDELVHL